MKKNQRQQLKEEKHLEIDLSYYDDIFQGKPIAGMVAETWKLNLPPQPSEFDPRRESRCIIIPKNATVIDIADLHGNKKDFQEPFKYHLKDQIKNPEYNIIFVLKGDYIHGLKRWEGKKGFPAYDDESLDLIREIVFWRDTLGNRIIPLLGDHELPLLFHGFPMSKGGEELTYEVYDKLTREQIEKIRRFPIIAKTQHGLAYSHFGPAVDLESLDELERISLNYPEGEEERDKFRAPPRPPKLLCANLHEEYDKYIEEIQRWREETILGQILYPRTVQRKVYEDEKEQDFSIVDELAFEKYSRAVSTDGIPVDRWSLGHSGLRFILEKNRHGIETKHLGLIGGFLDLGYARVTGTRECREYDDPEQTSGGKVNKFGCILREDTSRTDGLATLMHPSQCEIEYPVQLKGSNVSLHYLPETLRGLVCDGTFVRKGFHEQLARNFLSTGYSQLVQDYQNQTLPLDALVQAIDFFTNDKKENVIDVIHDQEPFLTGLNPEITKYFTLKM